MLPGKPLEGLWDIEDVALVVGCDHNGRNGGCAILDQLESYSHGDIFVFNSGDNSLIE